MTLSGQLRVIFCLFAFYKLRDNMLAQQHARCCRHPDQRAGNTAPAGRNSTAGIGGNWCSTIMNFSPTSANGRNWMRKIGFSC